MSDTFDDLPTVNADVETSADQTGRHGRTSSDPFSDPHAVRVFGVSHGRITCMGFPPQLREMSEKDVAAGQLLSLVGGNRDAMAWAQRHWGGEGAIDWRAFGRDLILHASRQGIFDASTAKLQGLGTWPYRDGAAINCGDVLVTSCNQIVDLAEANREPGRTVFVGAQATARPASTPVPPETAKHLADEIQRGWDFGREWDAERIVAAIGICVLAGMLDWRPAFYLSGARGLGKSALASIMAEALGPLSGSGVLDGVTEAGLRQSHNFTSLPAIIDEFEADGSPGQTATMAFLRSSTGTGGAKVLRGSAGHNARAFSFSGGVVVLGINPPGGTAADVSRRVHIEIRAQRQMEPSEAAAFVTQLKAFARRNAAGLITRALAGSRRWHETLAICSAEARRLGADAREADTLATVAAAWDVLTEDCPPDSMRLENLRPLLSRDTRDGSSAGSQSDGAEAIAWLLEQRAISPQFQSPRSISDLMADCCSDPLDREKIRALGYYGLRLTENGRRLHVANGHAQTKELFAMSRWKEGAHRSALLGLEGADDWNIRINGKRVRVVSVDITPHWNPGEDTSDQVEQI